MDELHSDDDLWSHEDRELDEAADFLLSHIPRRVTDAIDRVLSEERTPLGPGDPRLHHFIPQFFLRRFADMNEEVATVGVNRRHRVAHVSRTAAVKDFYRTHDEDIGDTVVTERLLAVLDGAASPAVERLALGVLFPPSMADRAVLGLWFALLMLRGPGHRRSTEAMSDHLMKMDIMMRAHRTDGPADLSDVEEYLDGVELVEHQNTHVALMMNMALKLAPMVGFRYFAVTKFEFDGLILPDGGVALWSQHRSPSLGIGVGTAEELRVPLDRRTLLTLHNDPEIRDTVFKCDNEKLMRDANQVACHSSHDEMYCHPDDVDWLLDLEFPSPERPLARVDGQLLGLRTDGINSPPKRRFPRRYTPPSKTTAT